MYKYLLILFSPLAITGPYIEVGLAVPLSPETGYTPDNYGIGGFGYIHHLDEVASIDIGFAHRSLTGYDHCNNGECNGDNAIEAKVRLEFR